MANPIAPMLRDHVLRLISAEGRERVEGLILPLALARHDYSSEQSAVLAVSNFVTHLMNPSHAFIPRWHTVIQELVRTTPVPDPEPEVSSNALANMFGNGSVFIDLSRGEGQEWGSLSDLHRVSGAGKSRTPSDWLRTKQAQRLIMEQSGKSQTALNSATFDVDDYNDVIQVVNGGTHPGTRARWELFTAFAEWLAPAFHLQVIRDWRIYVTGQAAQMPAQGALEQALVRLVSSFERTLDTFAKTAERLACWDGQRLQQASPVPVAPPGGQAEARAQVRIIVEEHAKFLIAQGIPHREAYESAYGWLYTFAEGQWGIRVRRHSQSETNLEYIDSQGLSTRLLELVKLFYPDAYARCQHRIESPIPRPSRKRRVEVEGDSDDDSADDNTGSPFVQEVVENYVAEQLS